LLLRPDEFAESCKARPTDPFLLRVLPVAAAVRLFDLVLALFAQGQLETAAKGGGAVRKAPACNRIVERSRVSI
jgi:hypothetical protein